MPKTPTTLTLRVGTLKRIHINTHVVREFTKTGNDQPAIIVRTTRGRYYGRHVEIHGDATVIQSLDTPMPGCGARIWIETRAAVTLHAAVRAPDACSLSAQEA